MPGTKKAPLTIRQTMRALGPGLVTGAADDDPSGNSDLFVGRGAIRIQPTLDGVPYHPSSMIAIQLVSAYIGRVTGKGNSGKRQRASSRFHCVHPSLFAARSKTFSTLRLILLQWGKLFIW